MMNNTNIEELKELMLKDAPTMKDADALLDNVKTTEETLGPVAKALSDRRKKNAELKTRKQQVELKKYIYSATIRYRRLQKQINSQLRVIKRTIGFKDYAMLKDICTVNVPEKKNDKGEVTQPANKYVNKQALLIEARNLVVLQRAERIKRKLRSAKSGRSSRRSSHNKSVKFLNARNEEAQKESSKSS